jgi:hypothetical protein
MLVMFEFTHVSLVTGKRAHRVMIKADRAMIAAAALDRRAALTTLLLSQQLCCRSSRS